MKEIEPISTDEFTAQLTTKSVVDKVDYVAYFAPTIEQAGHFAVGAFCWIIPDNSIMKIVAASANINTLTPFLHKDWIGKDPGFLASNIHPDDCLYVLSAIAKTAEIYESSPIEKREEVRVNIYGRMLDANNIYRFTLIQLPARYYNKDGRIESVLILFTDVSHLYTGVKNLPPMMTVIDYLNNTHQHFTLAADSKQLLEVDLPHITKREQQVLHLMAKGLTTPEIVDKLNISYHTAENHKRNLRAKTKTKTSVELINFIWSNNLF